MKINDQKSKKDDKKEDINLAKDFNMNVIKSTHVKENYLVSPYSIEIALNMLNEGADNNTKKEIESVISNRKISDITVKDKINVANAIFIKDKYKNLVKKSFTSTLVDDYRAQALYDKFNTPDVINNWVDKQTDGMIKKVVNDISKDFVLGLANAIAIDVEWATPFECSSTRKEEFTKANGEKINVEMMHNTFRSKSYKYLESDDAIGIIMPYQSYDKKTGDVDYEKGSNLEFVGILPNKDVESYINSLTSDSLTKLLDSAKSVDEDTEIRVSLPRFKYEYEIKKFANVLSDMGIKDAFIPDKADFTKMISREDLNDNLYVSTAVHKTYIDLNEKGTRAAAVTYFGMEKAGAIMKQRDVIEVKFNKPFVYMIRDSKTKELLFFGAVYEPNIWEGSTCS